MERLTGSEMNKLTVATMQVEALRKQVNDAQATIAALQAVIDDHHRLVREMDVAINGEHGAAKQASLCDIVSQVQQIQAHLTQRTAELKAANQHWDALWNAACEQKDTLQAELERVRGERDRWQARYDIAQTSSNGWRDKYESVLQHRQGMEG